MKTVWKLLLGVALASAMLLTACGSSGSTGGNGGGAGGALSIEADGENLAFKPAALSAKAGSAVTVNFKNVSTAQQHNWVLVNGGDDVAGKVDEAAIAAGAPNYLPTGNADILASTDMLAAGGTGTASFTAPAAGTYTFMCTYPGHFAAGMKGTLTVTP